MKRPEFLIYFLFIVSFISCNDKYEKKISSPDGNIVVSLDFTENGEAKYSINYDDITVIKDGKLGIIREDADFSKELERNSESDAKTISDSYVLLHGKKSKSKYKANQITFHLINSEGNDMDIIFRVSDDGVAYRYYFPGKSYDVLKIKKEVSSFNFPKNTKAWIQPRARSKSGWCAVNPSYEEHYISDSLLENVPASDSGWVFPALFKTNDCWVHITETWPEGNYCGSHLQRGNNLNEFSIAFPEPTEGFTDGVVYPESTLPWATPWRVITIGDNLGVIAESTLGTDVAEPSVLKNTSYIKPGRASWSWALMKDNSVNFETQVEFIDYASEMNWEYCLIDVEWDTRIGWEKMKELVEYAKNKNVDLILWYNSSGDWNTVTYTPKDKLLTSESRNAEFKRLKDLGIKGIKVDFFGGEGQSMMDYYIDILEDAHKYELVVNCHGATLPRGLHRTYPNLVSMESVRGFEFATFGQETSDLVPRKSTILPFTRNAFDPMDFTPVCFNEYDHNTRVTGNGAELAQAVLFLSGVQHYAEIPSGMDKVPEYVKKIMSEIPVKWDETHFVDAYPGKYIIIARRKDKKWFVAGINGEETEREFSVSLPFVMKKTGTLITEAETLRSFRQDEIILDEYGNCKIPVPGYGGFVMVFDK